MIGTRESNAKWSESEHILSKVSKIFSQFDVKHDGDKK